MVTFDGFPLGYEVFAGNTHDYHDRADLSSTMEARHGVVGRVWIADRGMASADNLAWLRQTGRRYLIGAPKARAAQASPPSWPSRSDWREIRDGIEVKLARWPDDGETAILCRSADRRSKEQAMHASFSQRIEAALAKPARRASSARPSRSIGPPVNRQIGRLLERNQRAAARFHIDRQAADCPAGFRLDVEHGADFDEWARLSEGCLRAAHQHHRLERRAAVEGLHPAHPGRSRLPHPQGSAAIRPIWHQRADRVLAHILVCFLAFVLWKCSRCGRARAGLGNSPRTVLDELARIQAPTSSCPPPKRTARSGCAASYDPTPPRPPCSIASACAFPKGCRLAPPEHNVVQTRTPKCLIALVCALQTAEVGLTN